jgi:hypothetical protein
MNTQQKTTRRTEVRLLCDGEALRAEIDSDSRTRRGRYEYALIPDLGIWIRRYQLTNLEFGAWRTI